MQRASLGLHMKEYLACQAKESPSSRVGGYFDHLIRSYYSKHMSLAIRMLTHSQTTSLFTLPQWTNSFVQTKQLGLIIR